MDNQFCIFWFTKPARAGVPQLPHAGGVRAFGRSGKVKDAVGERGGPENWCPQGERGAHEYWVFLNKGRR